MERPTKEEKQPVESLVLHFFAQSSVTVKPTAYDMKPFLQNHGIVADADIQRFFADYSHIFTAPVHTYVGDGVIVHIATLNSGKKHQTLGGVTVTPNDWEFSGSLMHELQEYLSENSIDLSDYKTLEPEPKTEAEVANAYNDGHDI